MKPAVDPGVVWRNPEIEEMRVSIEFLRAGVTLSIASVHTAWNWLVESSRCWVSLSYLLPLSTSSSRGSTFLAYED